MLIRKNFSGLPYIQNGFCKNHCLDRRVSNGSGKDNLDFNVKLNNFYLNTIGKYIDDIVSELNGRLSADLKLTGNFSRPVFKGNLNLNRVTAR